MASASSTVRETFTLPIKFEVKPKDPFDKSPSYQVTLSNKTWGTGRFNPQATFATVKNLTHTPALQPITVTVANIFRQDWISSIKCTRTSFTLVTGPAQLSTIQEIINGTRSISVEEGHPTQLVLSTVNLNTKMHSTHTQFISQSTDATTALSAGAEASTTALTQASAAPSTSDDASSAKHEATASSSALASVDMSQPSSTGQTSTSLAPFEEVEKTSDAKLRRQPSVDSTGKEVAYHTPTESPNPASGQATEETTLFTDMPPQPTSLLDAPAALGHNNSSESNHQQSFTPPPPPPNSDQSSNFPSIAGTPSEAADEDDVFDLPPPPVDN